MSAPLRMALGTLTALPVRAPERIDSGVAAGAMLLAPLATVPLAALAGALAFGAQQAGLPPLVAAVLAIGLVALGSRGLHLDGLADTADGLAASYDRDKALRVMRTGDSGPAGMATLLLVLLLQCAALAGSVYPGHGVTAAVAVLAGRSVLPVCCARGVPSARSDGLGAAVSGVAHPALVALSVVLTAAACAAAMLLTEFSWWRGPIAVIAGCAVAMLLLWRCVRRFGGVTGDVLGGCVETATVTALVMLAV